MSRVQVPSCSWFRELASGELDGEVSAGEAAALDEHLATCEECRGGRARVRRAVWLVRGVWGLERLSPVSRRPRRRVTPDRRR